jgi:hypothetical protein
LSVFLGTVPNPGRPGTKQPIFPVMIIKTYTRNEVKARIQKSRYRTKYFRGFLNPPGRIPGYKRRGAGTTDCVAQARRIPSRTDRYWLQTMQFSRVYTKATTVPPPLLPFRISISPLTSVPVQPTDKPSTAPPPPFSLPCEVRVTLKHLAFLLSLHKSVQRSFLPLPNSADVVAQFKPPHNTAPPPLITAPSAPPLRCSSN